jgi:hypothetical protein
MNKAFDMIMPININNKAVLCINSLHNDSVENGANRELVFNWGIVLLQANNVREKGSTNFLGGGVQGAEKDASFKLLADLVL